jgi:hypothetical protein
MRRPVLPRAVTLVALALLFTFLAEQSSWANPLWAREFGTPGKDQANGVAASGSRVFVGGYLNGSPTGGAGSTRCFLRAYSPTGRLVWARKFGSPSPCVVNAVAVGSDGVFVAGFTDGSLFGQSSLGGRDAFAAKFTFAGDEVWTTQFGTSSADAAQGLAVDSTGIYVSGITFGTLPGGTFAGTSDAFAAKLASDGSITWAKQFGTFGMDNAKAVALDASGVVVTGYVGGLYGGALPGQTSAGGQDVFVRQYDPNGVELWTVQGGSARDDEGDGIAVSGTQIVVAGATLGTIAGTKQGRSDAFVEAMSTSGTPSWTRQFGSHSFDVAWAVAADPSHFYVSGQAFGRIPQSTGVGDTFVRSYDLAGVLDWSRQLGSVSTETSWIGGGLAVTSTSFGVLVAGSTWGSLPGQVSRGDQDAFVAKVAA